MNTGPGEDKTAFIHEFVVDPAVRGQGLGTKLAALAVHPTEGIFGVDPSARCERGMCLTLRRCIRDVYDRAR